MSGKVEQAEPADEATADDHSSDDSADEDQDMIRRSRDTGLAGGTSGPSLAAWHHPHPPVPYHIPADIMLIISCA